MCDGDYNGCSDPDYYDVEFREQNPGVYGNDELMQAYRGRRQQNQNFRKRRETPRERINREFHDEYLEWRRNHPDKIKFFRSPSHDDSFGVGFWIYIVFAIAFYVVLITAIVNSCGD